MLTETYGVLAGAYRGGRKSLDKLLTHATQDEGRTALCGGVNEWNLAEPVTQADADAAPTCKRCLKKDPRFQK